MLIWTPPWPSSKLPIDTDIQSAWVMCDEVGLNFASHTGTPEQNVATARHMLLKAFPTIQKILWLNQVHSVDVVQIHNSPPEMSIPETSLSAKPMTADGSFITVPGIASVVLTADCLPVLFRDLRHGKVAAVHAGWRGLANGILQKTVALFDPQYCQVSIGPCISAQHFEVGDDVVQAFSGFRSFFISGVAKDKWLGDLVGIAVALLESCQISKKAISVSSRCTFEDLDLPSYRKDKTPLRMASLIWCA